MKYIFSSMGGSGSTYLINTLSKRYSVGNKPDTVFFTSVNGIDVDQGTFEERANGFPINPTETLEEVFPRYIAYLQKSNNRTVVFNVAAERGLFSKYEIPNVVFLIRHPMHAYVSWGKPERHKKYVDSFGGLNSPGAVNFYGNRWKTFMEECLRLKKMGILGGLIHFEYAHKDIKKLRHLEWVFKDFDSNKRNFGLLDPRYEKMLESIVQKAYFQIYDSWDL